MSVRALDSDHDWKWGNGKGNYISKSAEIAQNVKTRILSFKNDWVLDTSVHIDWFAILGNYSNEATIRREVERVTLETLGVKSLDSLEITTDDARNAEITIGYTDIYNESFLLEIGL